MSRRSNAFSIFLVLMLDVAIGVYWYLILLPSESMGSIATVGFTLLGVLFTVAAWFFNVVIYKRCVADD